MVAQDVRRVSLATWIGVAVGVGALIFAWLAWRVSKEELRLTQEEAERAEPHPTTGEDQEPAWRRWRRRWFGG
jgi:hypothetical protein